MVELIKRTKEYPDKARYCLGCIHIDDVDGSSAEFSSPIYICMKNNGYGNLLSFPFKNKKDCFE